MSNLNCDKDIAWLQSRLIEMGAAITPDGIVTPELGKVFIETMRNKNAQAITTTELQAIANELGDPSMGRIKAVAEVESAGGGWDDTGLVKILFERHRFYKYCPVHKRPLNQPDICNPQPGGYTIDADKDGINDSWEKLARAVLIDPLAALKSVSIGKFQVMGEHFALCGYEHPFYMLKACTASEKAHYELLKDFILKVAKIKPAFLKVSSNPADCVPFVMAYNGSGYKKNNYDVKLAQAAKKYGVA